METRNVSRGKKYITRCSRWWLLLDGGQINTANDDLITWPACMTFSNASEVCISVKILLKYVREKWGLNVWEFVIGSTWCRAGDKPLREPMMIQPTDIYRADSRFAPSQWETVLLCNAGFHWLGANLESALAYICAVMMPQCAKASVERL